MILALILCAFALWITFSMAGIKYRHNNYFKRIKQTPFQVSLRLTCRNENVTILKQKILPFVRLRSRESNDCTLLYLILLESFRVDSVLIENRPISFSDSNTDCSGTCQVTSRVETHITKSLERQRASCSVLVKEIRNEFHYALER